MHKSCASFPNGRPLPAKTVEMNKTKLRFKKPRNDENRNHPQQSGGPGVSSEIRYHQAILDVAYADWQQNKGWTYGDTVNNAAEKFGTAAKLFILIGKYNEQTCNGGHLQYMDNGYADGEGGCFRKHDLEMPLHKEMIQLFREFKLTLLPHGKEVLGILESFRVEVSEGNEACSECGGTGKESPAKTASTAGDPANRKLTAAF